MTPRPRSHNLAVGLAVSIATVGVVLLIGEAACRYYDLAQVREPPEVPLTIPCGDCPQLYELNPEHGQISTQGFRDREFALKKPEGVIRLMMLGDSVTHGNRVNVNHSFAKRLEARLRRGRRKIEVINAGVGGYSTYNEVKLYLDKGQLFDPDVVVITLCLNDVDDPLFHWNQREERLEVIPDAAIPNPEFHRDYAVPEAAARKRQQASILNRSALYRFAQKRFGILTERLARDGLIDNGRYARIDGKVFPKYIAGRSPVSIEVLTDPDSPESRWLGALFGELDAAVRANGATLIVMLVPLAYQVDEDYPFHPHEAIAEICRRNGILCLDVLPALMRHSDEQLYHRQLSTYDDIWHLNTRGHEYVAEELERFLLEHELVPPRPGKTGRGATYSPIRGGS